MNDTSTGIDRCKNCGKHFEEHRTDALFIWCVEDKYNVDEFERMSPIDYCVWIEEQNGTEHRTLQELSPS